MVRKAPIPNKYRDIIVFSKGRKQPYFMVVQDMSSGKLFIDHKYVGPTAKNHGYGFHIVDGKIDHWEKFPPAFIADEIKFIKDAIKDGSLGDMEGWCDGCCDIESEIAGE